MSLSHAMCVDTDPHTCSIVQEALHELGYEVTVVADGISAILLAQKQTFQLVVVSLEMPNVDGMELFSQLRQHHRGTQGIFLTTLPSGPVVITADHLGVRQIILKPVDEADFLLLAEDMEDHLG